MGGIGDLDRMGIDIPLRNELAALARQSLKPRQFPIRRDVELSGGTAASTSHTAFFDYQWIDARIVVVGVGRVAGAGLEDALRASMVRQLLGLCITRFGDPQAALDAMKGLINAPHPDLAIVRLDTASGAISAATVGDAKVVLAGATSPALPAQLPPETLVWITAGEVDAIGSATVPAAGLATLVDPALRDARSGSACALLFKVPGKDQNRTTLTLANEQQAIPQFLVEARRFLARHQVPEDVLDGMDIAFDEILTNCINYGFLGSRQQEILVSLAVEPGRFSVEIRDEGVAFDPLSVPEPDLSLDLDKRRIGGLGMHFVRILVDSVEYSRSCGWNILKLTKAFER